VTTPPAPGPADAAHAAPGPAHLDGLDLHQGRSDTDFSAALDLAGRLACDGEGGETLSVRSGDTLCPNGVNYCQVRAVATCQGTRP
jgi:hypothetical protein